MSSFPVASAHYSAPPLPLQNTFSGRSPMLSYVTLPMQHKCRVRTLRGALPIGLAGFGDGVTVTASIENSIQTDLGTCIGSGQVNYQYK